MPSAQAGLHGIPECLQITRNRLNSKKIVANPVFLVWRMQPVIGKAEAHEDGRDAEMGCEFADDGNGTAAAYEDRRLT